MQTLSPVPIRSPRTSNWTVPCAIPDSLPRPGLVTMPSPIMALMPSFDPVLMPSLYLAHVPSLFSVSMQSTITALMPNLYKFQFRSSQKVSNLISAPLYHSLGVSLFRATVWHQEIWFMFVHCFLMYFLILCVCQIFVQGFMNFLGLSFLTLFVLYFNFWFSPSSAVANATAIGSRERYLQLHSTFLLQISDMS